MTDKTLKIGGASGFWGDAVRATPQLLADGNLDFIVYDYLAEITMSIMARARAKDSSKGYALDFVSAAMTPHLTQIAAQGVRVASNAGGVNPRACADALRDIVAELGLKLTIACVTGDDLIEQREQLAGQSIGEMFSGADFPEANRLQSINAYLGAFPIARALDRGADIVITGRCVDSAVTLGACIHHFGWQPEDLDQLAMGSLAGHILECGPQATGGNFTDWDTVSGIDNIGYPIAEVESDGSFICRKPENTGGLVTTATVAEQMVYEIGDPQAYILPDVICDFSTVELTEVGDNCVRLTGGKGRPAPDSYKVCATYADQFRGGTSLSFYGIDADKKAQFFGESVLKSARRILHEHGLEDYSETSIELIGTESQFGKFAAEGDTREVAMKIAARHPEQAGIAILLRECVSLGLATPPGLSGFQGGRPRPSPVVRLFSFTLDKSRVPVEIDIDGKITVSEESAGSAFNPSSISRPPPPPAPELDEAVEVPLIKLAWGRSGDKGNKANVGIIARRKEYLPYIWAALDERCITERFEHFLKDTGPGCVERFLLPGSHALNILLHDVLGGGGIASIRNDAQGKGYAQILLACPVPVPASIAETLS